MKTNKTTDKATARPWKLTEFDKNKFQVYADKHDCIATITHMGFGHVQNRANAALIVQAVNEHAALLAVAEAAELALPTLQADVSALQRDWPDTYSDGVAYQVTHKLNTALAALAAVRGGKEAQS